jgi:hypothetical protein
MATLKIGSKYRTNPMSLEPGGSEIVVVFQDGMSYLYDNIKFPKKYVSSISKKETKHGSIVEVLVDEKSVWKSTNDRNSNHKDWVDFI